MIDSYPHHLAGDPAAAPTDPTPTEYAAALEAVADLQLVDGDLFAAPAWQLAPCLDQFRDEADAANPNRDRSSDGTIGDAAHAARVSKHNPDPRGFVLALDLDTDGLPLAAAFERLRAAAYAGRVPWLRQGGCLILNGRITNEYLSGWRVYLGANKHVTHGHADASPAPSLYESRVPLGVFAPPPPPPVAPRPPAPTPAAASGFRAAHGQRGPHVRRLQVFLTRTFPAYCKWNPTDYYGDKTAAGVREFAHRVGIREADGLNVGPKIAAALAGFGFGG